MKLSHHALALLFSPHITTSFIYHSKMTHSLNYSIVIPIALQLETYFNQMRFKIFLDFKNDFQFHSQQCSNYEK